MRINGLEKQITGSGNIQNYELTAENVQTSKESFRESLARNLSMEHTEEAGGPRMIKENAAALVPPRQLSYEECDKVEIHVLQGYTLKLKVNKQTEDSGSANGVYAEAKYEDGRTESYFFKESDLTAESSNHIMKTAGELMDRAGKE